MVERQFSKLHTRVRFPLPAPILKTNNEINGFIFLIFTKSQNENKSENECFVSVDLCEPSWWPCFKGNVRLPQFGLAPIV